MAQHLSTSLITPSDIEIIDGEPHIQDERLGAILGFGRARDIRQLIERHKADLQRFGMLRQVTATSPVGIWGGLKTVAITHLNRRQALFLAAKSSTPRAGLLTVEMVEVFDQYLSGRTAPPAPSLPAPIPTGMALVPASLLAPVRRQALADPINRRIAGFRDRGFSVREIAKQVEISPRRVSARVRTLVNLGIIAAKPVPTNLLSRQVTHG